FSLAHTPALHSFPTRRSSDLVPGALFWVFWLSCWELLCDQAGWPTSVKAATAIPATRIFISIPPAGVWKGNVEGREHVPNGMCLDRKSTRLNSSHVSISYAVF